MKKVHYLAGTAGLVPAALGVALPTATYAAAAPSAVSQAKTVSLHHAGAAAGACTGTPEFFVPQSGHVKGHGFYADGGGSVCIGTVKGAMLFTKSSFCKYVHLNINGIDEGKTKVCDGSGDFNVWRSGNFKVHQWFRPNAKVCLWSDYQTFFVCKTVT